MRLYIGRERISMKKLMILLAVLMAVALVGCGGISKRNLCRSWYEKGYSYPSFILYDDGTCEISGEYGTGTWALVNGDTLKLSNFYGETETGKVDSVTSRELHLSGGGTTSVFYSSPRK